jgi:two-component system sensor histidine kinase PilS (NtrC family)
MAQSYATVSDTRMTFWRTLQTFALTRAVITLVLLGYLSINTPKIWSQQPDMLYLGMFVAYLIFAFSCLLLSIYWKHRFLWQLIVQVSIDILAIFLLYVSMGSVKSGLAILFLFPLAGCAILAPLVLALFFVAAVTIVLLTENGYQLLNANADISSSQVGLYGAAFFIIIFAINRLAARLIKQETLAQERGKALHVQQAINRLVMADMGDGIVVVDRKGRVLTVNPAAAQMLGFASSNETAYGRLSEMPWLAPIAEAFSVWKAGFGLRGSTQNGEPSFVLIKHSEGTTLQGGSTVLGVRRDLATHLKLRFAKVSASGMVEERVVIFLQDVTEIENQAQQLKLASMGRLTASIAHEVRNPLSAIGHATALLTEDEQVAGRQRLLSIVTENVARLNRMIEDILKLSRKAHQYHEPLDLGILLGDILAELRETHEMPPDVIGLGNLQGRTVRFDPLHLREILMNLLTNALRYASGTPGSIQVFAVSDATHRLELHVQDDGPQITSAVRAHLFEPFYTTSSKGTGLGLYLARELCLNNGAMLNYEYRTEGEHIQLTGRFVIAFSVNEND